MQEVEFKLEGEYIELIQLLKAVQIASSGGEAKFFVEEGLIRYNDEVESRKRKKIYKGDTVVFDQQVKVNIV